jgi:PPOX class probable F420-dependent enzyme
MANIPDSFKDLLADETRAFAFLATTMPDGSPQVTPLWFNTDGTTILINSAAGRTKDRNMRAHPQVALAIVDPKNPYRYIQIRGKIVEITQEGADAHIDALAGKYTGTPKYGGRRPGEQRITYKILPGKVTTMG